MILPEIQLNSNHYHPITEHDVLWAFFVGKTARFPLYIKEVEQEP